MSYGGALGETMPPVRFRGLLGTVAVLASVVHVIGVAVDSRSLAIGGGVVALLALLGFVVLAGTRLTARVRWSLLAGLLGLAVVVAVGAIWYTPVTGTDFGWFAYAPLDDGLDRVIAHSLTVQRWHAFWLLLATGCLAVAAFAGAHGRHSTGPRWPGIVVTVVAVVLGGCLLVEVWGGLTGGQVRWPSASRLGDATAAMGIPLIAAAVPLACALVLARRPAARLAGAGLVLLAVPAVVAVGRAASSVPLIARYESGNTVTSVLVSTVDLAGPVDLSATVSAGALLAGVALVVGSCLRRPGTYGRRGLTAEDSG
jgi:hypothetical protein